MDQEVCIPSYNSSYHQGNNPYTVTDTRPRGYDNLVTGGVMNFVVDSAATIHTVLDKSYFYSYQEVNKTVSWGQAKSLDVQYQGDVLVDPDQRLQFWEKLESSRRPNCPGRY